MPPRKKSAASAGAEKASKKRAEGSNGEDEGAFNLDAGYAPQDLNFEGGIVGGVLDHITKQGRQASKVASLAVCGSVAAYHAALKLGHADAAAAMLPLPRVGVYWAQAINYDKEDVADLPPQQFGEVEDVTVEAGGQTLALRVHKASLSPLHISYLTTRFCRDNP